MAISLCPCLSKLGLFSKMTKHSSKFNSEWSTKSARRVHHPDYNNELTQFLPRTIVLKKPPGAQLGFNIRGGKASQLGIFISKVVPDSDAHRAGLQEGDQVLSVNDVDFQDIEHSRAVEILKTAREILMRVRFFPYNYQRQKERTVH
ncbi:unnamed protein product [Oreochromis niloticus]|nr:unnamed protein product [Mustela putorius furo]